MEACGGAACGGGMRWRHAEVWPAVKWRAVVARGGVASGEVWRAVAACGGVASDDAAAVGCFA
ncbi:hypothetical protein DNH61_16865 [Paenibacillus sambharensis]|uniref:Uncharacterized protein n=1 Tax=Paenibacillus sambharensis TaxID=1803190 RepID=A0A2W1L6Q0_9BACL|nr:hypothetical protein DNH61_16865 [Paenibacillus sambharensis]